MARLTVNGLDIAYEIIGDGPISAAITPGGRFSKDTPGVRELAQELAKGGCRVVIWDRPNCGESEINFAGESESRQNADTLAALLRALDFGRTLLIGGSGGAREMLVAAIHHPDVVARVFVLWLSGGAIGLATLPIFYCADSAMAAATHGMEAVADLPGWQDVLTRRPENRAKMLALDPAEFVAVMQRWSEAYFPEPGVAIPCVTPEQIAGIKVPVQVLRSGLSDLHHPRATSQAVAAAIPTASLAEPPWGDKEWLERLDDSLNGRSGLFVRWPLLAPQILAFAAEG